MYRHSGVDICIGISVYGCRYIYLYIYMKKEEERERERERRRRRRRRREKRLTLKRLVVERRTTLTLP
jgi:hypothetical protein